MKRTTKKVRGQLLDKSSKMVLSECLVNITLIDTQRPDDRPSYKATLTVDGYKPELDSKTLLLKLDDDLIGEIFIHISPHVPGQEIYFIVDLQDSIWKNLDWFKKL